MIIISINEESLEIDANTNIHQLLTKISSPLHGIAVAINNQIYSQDHWKSTFLKNNDLVLIIQATQGG